MNVLLIKQMTNTVHVMPDIIYGVFSDLLLSLLISLCSITPIWPGEACQGVHTLLHVPCDALLQ